MRTRRRPNGIARKPAACVLAMVSLASAMLRARRTTMVSMRAMMSATRAARAQSGFAGMESGLRRVPAGQS